MHTYIHTQRTLQALQRVSLTGLASLGTSNTGNTGTAWGRVQRRTLVGALLRVLMGPVDSPVKASANSFNPSIKESDDDSMMPVTCGVRAAEMLYGLVLDPQVEMEVKTLLRAYYGSGTDRVVLAGDSLYVQDAGLRDVVEAVNAVLVRIDESF